MVLTVVEVPSSQLHGNEAPSSMEAKRPPLISFCSFLPNELPKSEIFFNIIIFFKNYSILDHFETLKVDVHYSLQENIFNREITFVKLGALVKCRRLCHLII